jgi:hypothetical protein
MEPDSKIQSTWTVNWFSYKHSVVGVAVECIVQSDRLRSLSVYQIPALKKRVKVPYQTAVTSWYDSHILPLIQDFLSKKLNYNVRPILIRTSLGRPDKPIIVRQYLP